MSDIDFFQQDIGPNWEYVTCTIPFGIFPTRIIKCKTKNLINTFTYVVQKKYWFIGWVDIAFFSGENVGS